MRPVRGRSGYLYFLCRQKVPKVLVLRYGAGGNFVVLLSPNKRIKRGFRSVSPYGEEEGGCTFCVDKKYQKATRGGQLWRLRPGRGPLAAPPLTNFYTGFAVAAGLLCPRGVRRAAPGGAQRARRLRRLSELIFGVPVGTQPGVPAKPAGFVGWKQSGFGGDSPRAPAGGLLRVYCRRSSLYKLEEVRQHR